MSRGSPLLWTEMILGITGMDTGRQLAIAEWTTTLGMLGFKSLPADVFWAILRVGEGRLTASQICSDVEA